jgi:hypothetical protein
VEIKLKESGLLDGKKLEWWNSRKKKRIK